MELGSVFYSTTHSEFCALVHCLIASLYMNCGPGHSLLYTVASCHTNCCLGHNVLVLYSIIGYRFTGMLVQHVVLQIIFQVTACWYSIS
jgi:hypothetical protein